MEAGVCPKLRNNQVIEDPDHVTQLINCGDKKSAHECRIDDLLGVGLIQRSIDTAAPLVEESMNQGPTLRVGSAGPDVIRLQRLLVELKLLTFDHMDGTFTGSTERAVKDFQQGNGLTVDGIVGTQTWSNLPADPQMPRLSEGASGSPVSALQKSLKGYAAQNPAANPGPVDAVFGRRTEAAVRAYQSDRGVTTDGIVGDQTWWVPAAVPPRTRSI